MQKTFKVVLDFVFTAHQFGKDSTFMANLGLTIFAYLVNMHLQLLKFMFSKKATKIDEIFTVDLTLTTQRQINCEDFVNFCGLLRKHELYDHDDFWAVSWAVFG